jgi:hypothetical protein
MDGEKIFSRNYDRNCNSTVATFKRSKGFCLPNCQSKQPTPAIFKTKDLEVLVSCCNLGTPAADDGKSVERISPANARRPNTPTGQALRTLRHQKHSGPGAAGEELGVEEVGVNVLRLGEGGDFYHKYSCGEPMFD